MSKFSATSLVLILMFASAFHFVQNEEEIAELAPFVIHEMHTEVSTVTNFTSHSPISVGGYTTCVILNDGTVSCWGGNSYGELGNGDTIYSSTPTQVQGLPSGETAVQVEVGEYVACTLLESGRLFCWGRGSYVGDGTDEDRPMATEVITNHHDVEVSKVVVGLTHACALIANGSVMCWGQQSSGKLGDGVDRGSWDVANTPNYTLPLPDGRFAVDIGLNSHSTCVVLDNGTLSCWGAAAYRLLGSNSVDDQPNTGYSFGEGVSVKSITTFGGWEGGTNSGMCAILTNDTISCFYRAASISFRSFSPHSPVYVAIGARHACVILSDHSLMCWGDNKNGQIGDGTWERQSVPTLVPSFTTEPIIAVGAGEEITCAVTTSGKAYCWGSNLYGAVGDGTSNDWYEEPVKIDKIDPNYDVAEIILHDRLWCAIFSDGHLGCWGDNEFGLIGDGTTEDRSIKSIYHHSNSYFGGSVIDVQYVSNRACVLVDDGSIWCWEGSRNQGVLPEKVSQYGSTRFATSFVVGSNDVACAVQDNGEVSCWGSGHFGAIGDGNWDYRENPTTTESFGPTNPAVEISTAVGGTMCVLTNAAEVWCWGSNHYGSLGDGSTDWARNTPRPISSFEEDKTIVSLDSGVNNFCVLLDDGVVYCWGDNSAAGLGDGTREHSSEPIEVQGLPGLVTTLFKTNAWSSQNTFEYCVSIVEQPMYCWGHEWDGDIPPIGPTVSWESSDIDSNFELMSSALCLRSTSSDIWCWGYHNFIDADYNRTLPTNVSSFGLGRYVETPIIDTDDDGSPNLEDNCPRVPNPQQVDTDLDGLGDLCDDDDDNDGFADEADDCPRVVGSSEIEGQVGCPDSDEDGVLDSQDDCPNTNFIMVDEVGCAPDQIDTDGDGVVDLWDLCQGHSDLIDVDGNGIPDGCDDSDGDGVLDSLDICPEGDDNSDVNQNGIPDACEVVTQPPENETNPMNETNLQNETNSEGLNSTSEDDSDAEGVAGSRNSVWLYAILFTCLLLTVSLISLYFIVRRKGSTVQDDEEYALSSKIEAYTNQLVAKGYDSEYARAYATEFYSKK